MKTHLGLIVIGALLWSAIGPPRLEAGCGAKRCAPGLGAFSGYAPQRSPVMVPSSSGGWISTRQSLFAIQLATAAQAAARREAALAKAMTSGRNLSVLAAEAERDGDLRLASRLYHRLALQRPRTQYNTLGQRQLQKIQGAAFGKLQALEDELTDLKRPRSDPTGLGLANVDPDNVLAAFESLDALTLEYAGVSTVENRITDRIKTLRKDPKFAPVLQEPEAAVLWSIAQEHEEKSSMCCALLVLEQAAALTPAPSAKLAKDRLAVLRADQNVVAAAEQCRVLQQCHETFRQAQIAITANPGRAREFLKEIIESAPPDSEVYRVARSQIAALPVVPR